MAAPAHITPVVRRPPAPAREPGKRHLSLSRRVMASGAFLAITAVFGLGNRALAAPISGVTAERDGHNDPSFASFKEAQRASDELWHEVSRRRAELAREIGPRGLTVATVTLSSGATAELHAGSVNAFEKLWRRLPERLQGERRAVRIAVQDACARWDAEAERRGLGELERHATAARDRARAALTRLS